MRLTKTPGKSISIIALLMVLAACNQSSSHNLSITNTPLAATAILATPIGQTPEIALSDIANLSTSTAPAADGTQSLETTATEPPVAITAITEALSLEQQLAEIGQRQRETLRASTAHNAPDEMQLNTETRIQLLLNHNLTAESLGQQITEPGTVVSNSNVEITPLMKAELISPEGDAFSIIPITQLVQPVGDTETTEWLWYVTAQKPGSQTLTIVLSRLLKYENGEHWLEVDIYETNVNVRATFLDQLILGGWKWIAGILLLLAAIPVVRYLAGSGKNKSAQREPSGQEIVPGKLPGASTHDRRVAENGGHIFVSYRRSDSADITGRIYDRLVDEFGRPLIFKDVDSIPLGTDFKEYLDRKVSECNVLLAIIGDRWTDASDESGKRRLDDPDDFVRVEIESALARGIPVIPLLVRGAQMPKEESLPPGLRKLIYKNGVQIRPDPDFHRDMDRLISALGRFIGSEQRDE